MPTYTFSLGPASTGGATVSTHHFAANIMFDRDYLDEGGPFHWALEQLGVTGLRYPGGAITEELVVPGSSVLDVILSGTSPGIDPATGARYVTVTDLATFVNEHGTRPVIVLPSIYFLTDTVGEDGFRLIDYEALDGFLEQMRPLLQGDYGFRPHVVEIGNETLYGERMAPTEYGRLVDYVAPRLDIMFNDDEAPLEDQSMITVQVGLPWVAEQNADVLASVGIVAREAIDAVVGHYYVSSYHNVEHTTGLFDNMLQWDAALGRPLEHFISEWNVRSNTTTDTGLAQASMMLELMQTMLLNDIEHAAIWGTQMRNLVTRLSGIFPHPSVDLPPDEYKRWLTAPGELFRMMSNSLVGLQVLDINTPWSLRNQLALAPADRPEDAYDQAVLHAFGSDNTVVLFISSRTDRDMALDIDIAGLVPDYTHVWGQHLTVRDDPATATQNEGDPLSRYALPYINTLNATDLIQNGLLTVQLEPWAVVRVSINRSATGVAVFGYDQISDPALDYGDTLMGSAHHDTLSGFLGDDLISGFTGNDSMLGGVGNDTLNGGYGFDSIYGDAGADVLNGDENADAIYGGDGTDSLWGGQGFDIVSGGTGNDILFGGTEQDWMFGGPDNDTVHGGDGNDFLHGGVGFDTINGDAGNDRITGEAQADALYGGDGADTLLGEQGFDIVSGGAGNDSLYGGTEQDWMFGGIDNDRVDGGAGTDFLFGGFGFDTLFGGDDNDQLRGEGNADQLFGGNGQDTLNGDQGVDLLDGGAGDDLLVGGTENDTLIGGLGNDTLIGGDGADRFVFNSGHGVDRIDSFQTGIQGEVIALIGIAGLSDFAQVQANMSVSGTDTIIDLGAGNSLTVAGVTVLLADDFVFV